MSKEELSFWAVGENETDAKTRREEVEAYGKKHENDSIPRLWVYLCTYDFQFWGWNYGGVGKFFSAAANTLSKKQNISWKDE